MIGERDARNLSWLAALLLLQFVPVLLTPSTYFLRDLTYIGQPWRSLTASSLQSGLYPLWDPYAYLGMPLAANAQSEVLYPLSLPFYFFSFATALKLFHLIEYGLAAFLTYLWLRSWRLPRSGSAAAAAAFMLGGVLAARLEFLNLVAALALLPALALFGGSAACLALVLSLGLLAGHPQTFAAGAAEIFLLLAIRDARGTGRRAAVWAAAAAAAACLCAAAWLPFAELLRLSKRAGGLEPSISLSLSLQPRAVLGLLTAAATPADPSGARYAWWSALSIGLAAAAAASLGALRSGRRGLLLVAVAGLAVLFCLGGSTSISAWLWTNLAPLRSIRFPGNFTFLIILPLIPLIAEGFKGHLPFIPSPPEGEGQGEGSFRVAPLLALAVGIELLIYGAAIQPTAPESYWHDAGPMVSYLQAHLDGHRFFLSPKASAEQRGSGTSLLEGLTVIKYRLHGLSFLPWRLSSVAGAGEPLVPASSERAAEAISALASKEKAASVLAWLDTRFLLSPEPGYYPESPARSSGASPWIDRGQPLWQVYELPQAGQAFFTPKAELLGTPLGDLGPPPAPIDVARPSPDLEDVSGDTGAGWLILSRAFFPGWKAWVNGSAVAQQEAFATLSAYAVPSGPWRLHARYRPLSFALGCALSLLGLLAAAIYSFKILR